MMGLVLCFVLLAPATTMPVPPGALPPTSAGKIDELQANQFATFVDGLIQDVLGLYIKNTLTEKDLLDAAIRGLYEEIGEPVPDSVRFAVSRANRQLDRVRLLIETRKALGNHPNLAGSRSLFAAVNGLRHATDPMCVLSSPRSSDYVSFEQDFGIGIELEGVSGLPWSIYQAEFGMASGRYTPFAYFGTPKQPHKVPSPAVFPWRVRRIIPGSPAQLAGLRPDDTITHLNGAEITAENVDSQFAALAFPRQTFDANTGRALPMERSLTFRRGEGSAVTVSLKNNAYVPEGLFGVLRGPEKWDCMLDRDYKIGYIRLGAIENGFQDRFAEMLAELSKRGCRGLILDLRWCPGGYVTPAKSIAGLLLEEGAIIAKLQFPNSRVNKDTEEQALPSPARYTRLPLVVLIGPETIGGGELIAAALRDNNRCVLIGQRTFGRATITNSIDTGYCGMQFRVTNGTTLRPNGKSRQRNPDSQPTDEWGLRPDDGLEVPVTPDKLAELRRQTELHSLRTAVSNEALGFDDPTTDPHRLTALVYLRKKLGPEKR